MPPPPPPPVASLPLAVEREALRILGEWTRSNGTRRLHARDASLWTGRDEATWLGWLDLPTASASERDAYDRLAAEARSERFTRVLVLGMGGSSLCAEVLRASFPPSPGAPSLLVLDSTDPGQLADVAAQAPVDSTLVVVASKSGGTLEPNLLFAWFFDRAARALGRERAGRSFVAITDPGSSMERVARAHGFRAIHAGIPSVGGRFSALSAFGMVPAAYAGLDVRGLLGSAAAMAAASGPEVPDDRNPSVFLGAILGACVRLGRDKLTLSTSRGLSRFGTWLEQLVAESTGKGGKGVIPVDGEPLGPPAAYGADRLFVRLGLTGDEDPAAEAALDALAAAGHPVLRIGLGGPEGLGGEMFRWELATAVVGALLGVNPFDQPDVEASKLETKRLTEAVEASGSLPAETPFGEEGALRFLADPRNALEILGAAGAGRSLGAILRAHLGRATAGDYAGLLAWLPMRPGTEAALARIQARIRDTRRLATCVGFGPRFLHSTGQAYKGGPNTGVFLQLTCDDVPDLPVPGTRLAFGVVKAAQARGDFAVLASRGRRALRIHLGADVAAGLAAIEAAL